MTTRTQKILLAVALFVTVFLITNLTMKAMVSPTAASTANPTPITDTEADADIVIDTEAAGTEAAATNTDETGEMMAGEMMAGEMIAGEEVEEEVAEAEEETEQPYHVDLEKDANNLIQPSSIPMEVTDAQLIEIIAYNTRTRAHNALTAKYSKVLKTCYLTKLRTKIMKMVAQDTEAYGTWVAKSVVLNNLKCVSLTLTLPDDEVDNLINLFSVKVKKLVKGRHIVEIDMEERTVTVSQLSKDDWKERKFNMAKEAKVNALKTANIKARMKAAKKALERIQAIEDASNLTYDQHQAKAKAKAKARAKAKAKTERRTLNEKVVNNRLLLKRLTKKVRALTAAKRNGSKLEVISLDN